MVDRDRARPVDVLPGDVVFNRRTGEMCIVVSVEMKLSAINVCLYYFNVKTLQSLASASFSEDDVWHPEFRVSCYDVSK